VKRHKRLKICKRTKQKKHFTQAQRREAQSPEISGPRQRGGQVKTEAYNSTLRKNTHRLTLEEHSISPNKNWSQDGPPLVARLGSNLVRAVSYGPRKSVAWVLAV
jgi:hypothetical protein